MLGYPLGRLFAAPVFQSDEAGAWTPLGPASDFSEERRDVEYAYDHQEGWYLARRMGRVSVGKVGDDFVILSTKCTHAGCGVSWSPETQKFHCPCHDGEFSADGAVLKGPAPRPLDRLDWRVSAAGELEVREA
jgi:Rieske Fe-S protein